MNYSNENITFTMAQHKCQHTATVKKSFSLDNLSTLLSFEEGKVEEGKDEDITVNVATALLDSFLKFEQARQYNSKRLRNQREADEDVISHDAIAVCPPRKDDESEANTMDCHQPKLEGGEQCKAVSDVPTVITHSTYGETDDDCSNDSVSTMGIDAALNDNPRSIFPKYWHVKNPKAVVPQVVMSRSFTSAHSSPIHEHAAEGRLHTHLPEETYAEYARSQLFRRDSTCSNNSKDYEMTLRRYERGRTTIPRAAVLNDQTTNISNNEDNPSSSLSDESDTPPVDSKTPKTPKPTKQRKLFSNDFSSYVSNLPSYRYSDDYMLKTSSTSALLQERAMRCQRSCLRPLTRSSSAIVGSEIGGRVTFDPNVSVLEYDRPVTNYARHGWSKWFV